MILDTLKVALREQPFRPFVPHTTSGRAIRVAHPAALAYGSESTVVCIVGEGGAFDVVDLDALADLEFEGVQPGHN
jgi:hypothetical protein